MGRSTRTLSMSTWSSAERRRRCHVTMMTSSSGWMTSQTRRCLMTPCCGSWYEASPWKRRRSRMPLCTARRHQWVDREMIQTSVWNSCQHKHREVYCWESKLPERMQLSTSDCFSTSAFSSSSSLFFGPEFLFSGLFLSAVSVHETLQAITPENNKNGYSVTRRLMFESR